MIKKSVFTSRVLPCSTSQYRLKAFVQYHNNKSRHQFGAGSCPEPIWLRIANYQEVAKLVTNFVYVRCTCWGSGVSCLTITQSIASVEQAEKARVIMDSGKMSTFTIFWNIHFAEHPNSLNQVTRMMSLSRPCYLSPDRKLHCSKNRAT